MLPVSVERADADCCLSDLGSVNTPKCIIQWQKEIMMAKGGSKGMDSPPGACQGRSLVEMMEDQLDGVFNWLKDTDMNREDPLAVKEMQGRAQGIAECLAIIQSPYAPNVNAVKADAVRRWEWRRDNPPSWSSAGSRASEMED